MFALMYLNLLLRWLTIPLTLPLTDMDMDGNGHIPITYIQPLFKNGGSNNSDGEKQLIVPTDGACAFLVLQD